MLTPGKMMMTKYKDVVMYADPTLLDAVVGNRVQFISMFDLLMIVSIETIMVDRTPRRLALVISTDTGQFGYVDAFRLQEAF